MRFEWELVFIIFYYFLDTLLDQDVEEQLIM